MEYQLIRVEDDGTEFFVDQFPSEEEALRAVDNHYLNEESVNVEYRVWPVYERDVWEEE